MTEKTEIKCSLTIELAGADLELEGSYTTGDTPDDGTLAVKLSDRCLKTLEEGGGFDLKTLATALADSLGVKSIAGPVEHAFKVTEVNGSEPGGAKLYITKFDLVKDTATTLTLGLRIKFGGDNAPTLLGITLKSFGVEVTVGK